MMALKNYFFSNFPTRTKGVLKNVILSVFVKFCSISVSLLVVPFTLSYMSQNHYGVWLTIYSLMNWLQYFDGR